jgi:hypothetical protein
MAWETKNIETRLNKALNTFNWSEAEKICRDLIAATYESPEPYPENSARRLLAALRRKQRFDLMSSLAEAFIRSGELLDEAFARSGADYLQIMRQYAQSLIEQGNLTAATELVLNLIIEKASDLDDADIRRENFEARGLLGRIYKQLYVNSDKSNPAYSRQTLQKALDAYYGVYKSEPDETWHGINAVAVIKRAERDEIILENAPDPSALATQIKNTIEARDQKEIAAREEMSDEELQQRTKDTLPPWDIATKIEALIANGYYEPAEKQAFRYTEHEWADAFEIASTLRQLKEIWKLTDMGLLGSNILSILHAAHLQRRGVSTTIFTENVEQEQKRVQHAIDNLEAKFDGAKTQTLQWLKNGLKRCESIARIEKLDGKGHGTGWLVDGGDFFPGMEGQPMVLTNYHVVSPTPFPRAILPTEAQINFQVHTQTFKVKNIYWSSPVEELDATFLTFDGQPKAEPLPISDQLVKPGDPMPRLFVIGHPGGRDVELSLEDNLLIASNEKYLHYRAPTEKGSSGSPIFEELGWQVVALHHAGSNLMKKLDNPNESYEANEGITIRAIRQQTQQFVHN